MIVDTIVIRNGICHIDDSAYKNQTPEQVDKIIRDYSEFIIRCLLGRRTA